MSDAPTWREAQNDAIEDAQCRAYQARQDGDHAAARWHDREALELSEQSRKRVQRMRAE